MAEVKHINASALIIKPPYFTSFEQQEGKSRTDSADEIVLPCVH